MTRSPVLALLVAAALALASTPARAIEGAPAAADTVHLRDGGLVRGTIVDLRPGASVTILRAGDGASLTFPWDQVASTGVGSEAGGGAGAQPTAAAQPTPDAGGRGLPRLTIETRSRRPVHLFTAGEGPTLVATSTTSSASSTMTTIRSGVALRSVCQAPCEQVIDGRQGYPFFFGGDRMPLSRPIYLNYAEGELHAVVRPGRLGLLMGGVFAVSYGAAGAIVGGTLVGLAPDRLAKPGGILLGTGAALLIAGVVMLVHGRTRYTLRPGRAGV